MIRGFHLADWITLANGCCGTGAILVVMRQYRVASVWKHRH
jgi:phosphatidylserine synthase